MAEQRAFEETPGKKEFNIFWKKDQTGQEEYKNVDRMSREKIRKTKAQVKPNLANVVKVRRILINILTARGVPRRIFFID